MIEARERVQLHPVERLRPSPNPVEDGGELLVLSGIFLISVVWSTQPNELADGSRG